MIIIGRYDRDYGPPPGNFGPGPGFHDYPGPPPHRGGGRRKDEGKTWVSIVLLLNSDVMLAIDRC